MTHLDIFEKNSVFLSENAFRMRKYHLCKKGNGGVLAVKSTI